MADVVDSGRAKQPSTKKREKTKEIVNHYWDDEWKPYVTRKKDGDKEPVGMGGKRKQINWLFLRRSWRNLSNNSSVVVPIFPASG